MAPSTRSNASLQQKIATLRLPLAPLVPLPSGPPHPAFPKTLMAYHLLTEEELDSIAHYYHQSTPGVWTMHYPACMNWDEDFLSKPSVPPPHGHARRLSREEKAWLDSLIHDVEQLKEPEVREPKGPNYAGLSDAERVRIKRRKVGKFIGLVGMDTPIEEIEGRLQACFERAVERGREETRRNEEVLLRRKKMA